MRTLLLIFIFFGMVFDYCEANWYIVAADNQVIAKCDYQPDAKDLESRKEKAVFSEEDIYFYEADYSGGKITKSKKISKDVPVENKQGADEPVDQILENPKSGTEENNG